MNTRDWTKPDAYGTPHASAVTAGHSVRMILMLRPGEIDNIFGTTHRGMSGLLDCAALDRGRAWRLSRGVGS